MKRENTEKGSVTIEAAIILPIFCALFMALNGFFFVFNAQNQIAHALVQSATSLGMDSYANNQIASGLDGANGFWGSLSDLIQDGYRRFFSSKYFSSPNDWYAGSKKGMGAALGMGNDDAKRRFVAYLTGDTSDSKANQKLKAFGVERGLDGMNFKVESSGGDVTLTVTYKMGVWFDMFGKKKMDVTRVPKQKCGEKSKQKGAIV